MTVWAAALLLFAAPQPQTQYANPLDLPWADPAALWWEGKCYLAGTGFGRAVSTDLVHWRWSGHYVDPNGTWLRDYPWAAELHQKDGRCYYVFCQPGEGTGRRRAICIAVADSPDQTFQPHAFPIWTDEYSWIDGHLLQAADGSWYLFATRDDVLTGGPSTVWVAKMSDDLKTLAGPLTLCLAVSQPWERGVQEGAWAMLHQGTYYLMYSSHGYGSPNYSVGYATAPSPLGPWTKAPENPILARTGTVSGPGHNSVIASPDGTELFTLYHTHISRNGGGSRQLNLDRLRFVPNPAGGPDRLVIDGPTSSPQPLPLGAVPLTPVVGAERFDGDALDRGRWPVVWRERPADLRVADGALWLRARPGDLHHERSDAGNIVLRSAPEGDWTATVRLTIDDLDRPEQSGLLVWQDADNYLILKKVYLSGKPQWEAALELNGTYTPQFIPDPFGPTSWLRITHRDEGYLAEVSADQQDWQAVGRWRATLTLPRIGLAAFAIAKVDDPREARFDTFEVQALP